MGGSCFPEFLMTKQGYIVPIACLDLLLSQDFLKRKNILLLSILEFLVPWTVFFLHKIFEKCMCGLFQLFTLIISKCHIIDVHCGISL